jgi:hypothetical protein
VLESFDVLKVYSIVLKFLALEILGKCLDNVGAVFTEVVSDDVARYFVRVLENVVEQCSAEHVRVCDTKLGD